MKLKIKNLDWLAGRPVAILNDVTSKKMNVFVDDRIEILNSKKVYAVVDIFPKLVKNNEIGLSKELSKILGMKNKSSIEVGVSPLSGATSLIKRKLQGEELNREELSLLIHFGRYLSNDKIPYRVPHFILHIFGCIFNR